MYYDDLIKYFDENSWKKYFNNDLASLLASLEGFINLHNGLKKSLDNKPVNSIIEKAGFYKNVFYGGMQTTEDEPLLENALARFYWVVFGLGVGKDVLSKIISRMKEGLKIDVASKDVKCIVGGTGISSLIFKISQELDEIFKMLKDVVERPKAKNFEIKDENFGIEALKCVLNAGKAILPLYNPISFFVCSLYSIPYFYAKKAYPKLFEEETKILLEKYGLKLTDLLLPDLPDEKVRNDRKIIGWEDNSVGILIIKVIWDLYELFSYSILSNFFEIEDEFKKYVKESIISIKRSMPAGIFSNLKSKISALKDSDSFFRYPHHFQLPEGYSCLNVDVSLEGGTVHITRTTTEKTKLNYSELIAFLAPQMFLDLAYIRPFRENEFRCLFIVRWPL